jgi:hypothetical protein
MLRAALALALASSVAAHRPAVAASPPDPEAARLEALAGELAHDRRSARAIAPLA